MSVIAVLMGTCTYRGFQHGKEEVKARLTEFERRAEAVDSSDAAVIDLKMGALPDYSDYRAGAPLGRDLFLAWKLDTGATTLAKEAFLEKVEGAEVTWELEAGDLRTDGARITGDFYLRYRMSEGDGSRRSAGVEEVNCEFAPGARDSLLAIRRGGPVLLRGRLSLKNGITELLDAVSAMGNVEK